MPPLPTYPTALASTNFTLGWFLYQVLDSPAGGVLIFIGFLITCTIAGHILKTHWGTPQQSHSTDTV